jgi:hypothetical protein
MIERLNTTEADAAAGGNTVNPTYDKAIIALL